MENNKKVIPDELEGFFESSIIRFVTPEQVLMMLMIMMSKFSSTKHFSSTFVVLILVK